MARRGERTQKEDADIYRLAQARAFLRAVERAMPPGTDWQSVDEVTKQRMSRALQAMALGPDGKIKPSHEDIKTAKREYIENSKKSKLK